MARSFLILFLGIYLSHEAQALNKECMKEMQVMVSSSTKLIVPCIESLGLTTPEQKKEKALVHKNLNMKFDLDELIRFDISLKLPIPFEGVWCVMKCVLIRGKMLGPDGSVDMDLAQTLLDNLPDALKEKASNVIGECGHTAASLDPSDASCESYREFIECMLDVSLKMCND